MAQPTTKVESQDDFELPDDVMPEPVVEQPRVQVIAEDLHLGAPEIKGWQSTWLDKHGPRPPGLRILALDGLVGVLAVLGIWLIAKAWIWAIFS